MTDATTGTNPGSAKAARLVRLSLILAMVSFGLHVAGAACLASTFHSGSETEPGESVSAEVFFDALSGGYRVALGADLCGATCAIAGLVCAVRATILGRRGFVLVLCWVLNILGMSCGSFVYTM